jgi:hypothetical protein
MQNLCGSVFVVIGAGGKIGHLIEIVREWVHVMWICFAGGVMCVQGRDHCQVKQVHLFGYGRLVHLCAFAYALE